MSNVPDTMTFLLSSFLFSTYPLTPDDEVGNVAVVDTLLLLLLAAGDTSFWLLEADSSQFTPSLLKRRNRI